MYDLKNLLPLIVILPILFCILFFIVKPWYRYSTNFRKLFIKNFSVFSGNDDSLVDKFSGILVLPVRKNFYINGGYVLLVDILLYSNNELVLKYFSKELNVNLDNINVYKISQKEQNLMKIYKWFTPMGYPRNFSMVCEYVMEFLSINNEKFYFAIEEKAFIAIKNLKGGNND